MNTTQNSRKLLGKKQVKESMHCKCKNWLYFTECLSLFQAYMNNMINTVSASSFKVQGFIVTYPVYRYIRVKQFVYQQQKGRKKESLWVQKEQTKSKKLGELPFTQQNVIYFLKGAIRA